MNPFWSYWYFHFPNFVLAAVMYTVLGRLVLGFFVPENWDNYIWRGFKAVSEPAVAAARAITPALVAHPVVLVFTALWLLALRIVYFFALAGLGLAPTASTGAT